MKADRENMVKKILLEELGTLSYAEKKHVEEVLDRGYVDKEIVKIWRRKKNVGIITIAVALVLVMNCAILIAEDWWHVSLLVPVLPGLALAANYAELKKRELVYRVLKHMEE